MDLILASPFTPMSEWKGKCQKVSEKNWHCFNSFHGLSFKRLYSFRSFILLSCFRIYPRHLGFLSRAGSEVTFICLSAAQGGTPDLGDKFLPISIWIFNRRKYKILELLALRILSSISLFFQWVFSCPSCSTLDFCPWYIRSVCRCFELA